MIPGPLGALLNSYFSDFDPICILDAIESSDSETTASSSSDAPPPKPPHWDEEDLPAPPPPGSAQFKIGQAGSITVNFIFYNDGQCASTASDGAAASDDWWKSYVDEILASFKVSGGAKCHKKEAGDT